MEVQLIRTDDPRDLILIPDLPAMIGRHPTADVRLQDTSISPFQCMVEEHEGTLRVRHICGRWVVFVNGVRVTEATVMPGDILKIGEHQFRVEYQVPARVEESS